MLITPILRAKITIRKGFLNERSIISRVPPPQGFEEVPKL